MADVIMIVNKGFEIINNRLKGTGTEPKYIDWGTGTTTVVGTDVALETPGTETRSECTTEVMTVNTANDSYKSIGTIVCNAIPKAITEVGLFDASTAGGMFLRGVFAPINVGEGDSIQFTITNTLERKV